MVFSDGSVLVEVEATGGADRHPADIAGQGSWRRRRAMIGGDAPHEHEGGDPAEGTSWRPPHPHDLPTDEDPAPNEDSAAPPAAGRPRSPEPQAPELPSSQPPSPRPRAPEPTGDERVDAALARFDELAAAPVADHVEVFEDVQRRLQDVLASVDHDERPAERAEPAEQAAPGAPFGAPPRPRPGPPSWGS
jgi:hypothetical protein